MFGKKKKTDAVDPKKEYTCEIKLCILGPSHTGKTTVLRQLQLITDESAIDKRLSQRVILSNTIDTVTHLIKVAEKLGLEVAEENKERVDRIKALPSGPSEFRQSRFPLQTVYDFSCVWKDEALQEAYAHTLRNQEDVTIGRPQYYMDNIFRIFSPEFKPEDLDILSAYEQTGSLQIAEVFYRKVKILTQCFPGEITDSRKWSTLDSPPDVIIFTINLNNFDLSSPQNHLIHTLDTLEHLSQNWEPFTKSHCVVLLNYKDLFMEKAATVDMKCCFPDYNGGLDAEKALAYVVDLFNNKACKANTHKVFVVSALEKKTISSVLDELMDRLAPEIAKRSVAESNGKHSPRSPRAEERSLTTAKDAQKEKDKDKDKEKKKKTKGIVGVESGVESVQGRRKNMEDTHVIIDDVKAQYPVYASVPGVCSYFGVYDGHGGAETSKLVEQLLHKNILEDPQFAAANYEAGLKSAFEVTDKFIVTQPSKSGSTAVVSIVIDNQLFVANAGDSEAILGRQIGVGKKAKFEPVVLSYKHLPTDEQEKQRISAAGGLVVFGRLFGSLAVSRSFGDKDFKDGAHFVSAEPFIKQIELTPQDQFIVMACDGLWDKLSYEDVINTVTRLRKEGKNATDIGKALVQEALEKESLDNVTVVVVFLQWKK